MSWRIPKELFRRHPLLANSVVYGSLYVGAEFSQQIITRKVMAKPGQEDSIDGKALGRYLVVGSVINSNYLFAWYKWLDGKYQGTTSRIITKKILLDQFVMTPPLYVIFYVSMSLMEGRKDLMEECRTKFFKTFAMSCFFWIPAQIFNFVYLPNTARVVYLGFCSFVWVNILCWIKKKLRNINCKKRKVDEDEECKHFRNTSLPYNKDNSIYLICLHSAAVIKECNLT